MTTRHAGRSLIVLSSGGNLGGTAGHGQLGESIEDPSYGVQINQAIDGVHASYAGYNPKG